MKKRPQITLQQAILAPVKQVMMYYLLLVRRINVKQFVMQHRQLTLPQAILAPVFQAIKFYLSLVQHINVLQTVKIHLQTLQTMSAHVKQITKIK